MEKFVHFFIPHLQRIQTSRRPKTSDWFRAEKSVCCHNFRRRLAFCVITGVLGLVSEKLGVVLMFANKPEADEGRPLSSHSLHSLQKHIPIISRTSLYLSTCGQFAQTLPAQLQSSPAVGLQRHLGVLTADCKEFQRKHVENLKYVTSTI